MHPTFSSNGQNGVDGTSCTVQQVSAGVVEITCGATKATIGTPITTPCTDPSNRFADCGNGVVYDQQTKLIWTKQTGCDLEYVYYPGGVHGNHPAYPIHQSWATVYMQDGRCGLSDNSKSGDWRLPRLSEAMGVINQSCRSRMFLDASASGSQSFDQLRLYHSFPPPSNGWDPNPALLFQLIESANPEDAGRAYAPACHPTHCSRSSRGWWTP